MNYKLKLNTVIIVFYIIVVAVFNLFIPEALTAKPVPPQLIIASQPEPDLTLPPNYKGHYAVVDQNSFIYHNSRALVHKIRTDEGWAETILAVADVKELILGDLLEAYPGSEMITTDGSECYPTVWAFNFPKQSLEPLFRGKHAWDKTQRLIVGKFRNMQSNSLIVQTQNGILHMLDVQDSEMNLIWKSPKPIPAVDRWKVVDIDGDGRDEIVGTYYDRGIFILKEVSGALVLVWENYPWGKVLDIAVRGEEIYFTTAQKVFGVISFQRNTYKMKVFTSRALQPYRWLLPLDGNRILGVTSNSSFYEISVEKTIEENLILPTNGQILRLIPLSKEQFITIKANNTCELWFTCSPQQIRLFINGKKFFPNTESQSMVANLVSWQAGQFYFHPELFANTFGLNYDFKTEDNNGLTIGKKGETWSFSLNKAHTNDKPSCIKGPNDTILLSETAWKEIIPKLDLNVKIHNDELQLGFSY